MSPSDLAQRAAPRAAPTAPARPDPARIEIPASVVRGANGSRHWLFAARTGVLVATDLAALFVAGTVAFLLWASPVRSQEAALYLELMPLLSLFIIGYANAGLYPGFGLGPVETLRRYTLVTGSMLAILAVISFGLKVPHIYSRVTVAIAGTLALLLVPLARGVVLRVVRRRPWWREPVVVIGSGPRSRFAVDVLKASGSLGYRPAGIVTLDPEESGAGGDVPVLGGVEVVPELARHGLEVALVEAEDARNVDVNGLRQHFRRVMTIRGLDDLPVEGLQLRNLGGVVALEYTNNLLVLRNRILKRGMDVVLAAAGLAVSLPVIGVAALLVKLISPGPAFFVQERVGKRGRILRVPKIRSMHDGAARELEHRLTTDPDLQDEWSRNFKLRSDPRVVPVVGRPLRRFSIDELPQLWSVLKGEMSLVGPRPLPAYHEAALAEDFRRLRRRVRPGLTGLWQVTARGDGRPDAYEGLDTYYIQNWSPWLDIYILGRTVRAILGGRGAY